MITRDDPAAFSGRRGAWLAAWEICARWLAVMLATLALGQLALRTIESIERREVLDAKIRTTLEQIGDRLEARLSLGLDLADIADAQTQLEQTLARERSLATLDVIDANGVFIASTDRASVRRTAPPEWVEIAKRGNATVSVGDDRLIFVGLEGGYGERVGSIVASYRLPQPPATPVFRLIIASVLLATCLWILALHVTGIMRRPVIASLHAMSGSPGGAEPGQLPNEVRSAIEAMATAENAIGKAARELEALGRS